MKARPFFALLVVAFVVWLVVVLTTRAGDAASTETTTDGEPPLPQVVERTLQGLNVEQWHSAAARYLGRMRSLQATIRRDPETSTAVGLACIVYGHCAELWRKARCESHLYRYAHNPSGASGLFQFLPSTWHSTPFGGYSIYDPYANALAAGWMHEHGRGGEWVCQ